MHSRSKLIIFSIGIFLLNFYAANAQVVINEVMSNPTQDEDLNEWIELFNNDSQAIDVKGWKISDDSEQDLLLGGLYGDNGTIIPAFGFAIITDYATRVYNNFNASNYAIKLYAEDDSIGNGLSNSGETLTLLDNNSNIMHSASYNNTADGNTWALYNNNWYESSGTPGYSNDGNLFINCDWTIDITVSNTSSTQEDFEFTSFISKAYSNGKNNLTLKRWIEDSNGNIVQEYSDLEAENVLDHRTYKNTPNLDEGQLYTVHGNITSNSCADANLNNNNDEENVFIKSIKNSTNSSLNIVKLLDLGTDKKAKWGQTIKVQISLYKGKSSKSSFLAWIEKNDNKVSKQSKFNAYKELSDYDLTIPIQIVPNCNKGLKDGDYVVVVEGLDLRDTHIITLEGITSSLCEVVKEEVIIETEYEEQNVSLYSELENPDLIEPETEENQLTGNVVYESSDVKASGYAIYILSFILIIILVYFIFKR